MGTDEMIDVQSVRCQCGKRPTFGMPGTKRRTHCKACKIDDMVDLTEFTKGRKRASPSMACTSNSMADVKIPHRPCGKQAVSGTEGNKRTAPSGTCKGNSMVGARRNICKTDNILQLTSSRCQCGDVACFATIGSKHATHCRACKTCDMVDITDPLCPCGAQRAFGFPGAEEPSHCKPCRTDGMVNLHCLAQKRALGSLPGASSSTTPRSASSAMSDDEGRNSRVVNDQPDVSLFCGLGHSCTPKPEPDRLQKSTILNSRGGQEQLGSHCASTRSLDA